MKRRQFITLLGGAAVTWPLAARAQQPMRRVAVLMPIRATDPEEQARVQALVRALQQLGWTDGRNLRIELRSAGGSAERSREIAAEFVALAPDVIISSGSVTTAAMKRATSSIPVVFVAVNEPVEQGFVASLAQPGGNITGFTLIDFTVIGKSVELLKAMALPVPNALRLLRCDERGNVSHMSHVTCYGVLHWTGRRPFGCLRSFAMRCALSDSRGARRCA
jgi:putative ABC transport system substrate-binding protein